LAVHNPVVIDGAARVFMGSPRDQFQLATRLMRFCFLAGGGDDAH